MRDPKAKAAIALAWYEQRFINLMNEGETERVSLDIIQEEMFHDPFVPEEFKTALKRGSSSHDQKVVAALESAKKEIKKYKFGNQEYLDLKSRLLSLDLILHPEAKQIIANTWYKQRYSNLIDQGLRKEVVTSEDKLFGQAFFVIYFPQSKMAKDCTWEDIDTSKG
ncbi:MAG: hypothetical protein S4CHLAM123_04330 [Chlamydiales bacterium]|nr:hypothetical protein [Chlamydiales bacterium]